MSQRRVQIVILCEDRQQEVFARYFLKKRGFTGQFRANICPKGSQAGEQYVYPRSRSHLRVILHRRRWLPSTGFLDSLQLTCRLRRQNFLPHRKLNQKFCPLSGFRNTFQMSAMFFCNNLIANRQS